jgi:phosphate-selective porin OprO and OprP
MYKRSLLSAAIMLLFAQPAWADIVLGKVGDTEVKFEGLVQADYDFFSSDRAQIDDQSEVRRAELVLKGKTGAFDWIAGYDAKADKWLDLNAKYAFNDKIGLRFGQFKQPIGLEELGSTKHNDFVSKAMITNSFALSRRLGAQLETGGKQWTASVSAFGAELTPNRAHGSGYGLRGTYAPVLQDTDTVHLGLSYVNYDTPNDTKSFSARPADLSLVRLINTGSLLRADRVSTVGLEAAWLHGPFKLQGEYMQTHVKRYAPSTDFDANGWYISGMWNIGGQKWGYKNGVIRTPAAPDADMWQLGVRYDSLDLDDGSVLGGTQKDLTVAVNYYWRANAKVALDYTKVSSDRRGLSDDPNVLQARLQFYW